MAASDRPDELRLTRVYDAPVALVWEAWTDPAQAAQWWGPRGFTLTTHRKDLRPGGTWVYTMHGPDGTDYPNTTVYHEVRERELLVYDHGGSEDRPPLFRVTVRFADLGGKTRMDLTMTLPTAQAAAEIAAFIKKAGGNATWDRLAEYLGEKLHDDDLFVINRSFAAPIETVYRMWTDPAHFVRWLPPTGFDMEFLDVDIRPGGSGFYRMGNGAGVTMYGRIRYLELVPPRRLVYTQQFTDAEGRISRHPMVPVWPETMHAVVELDAEGPAHTRVTVTWNASAAEPAEREAFRNMRPSMTQGWTGSFDKLEGLLAREA